MKQALRTEIKKKITALNADERKCLSKATLFEIEQLPEFQEAKTVLLFWSLPDELITHEFLDKWHTRKKLLLPVVNGDELELRRYTGSKNLETGRFGIPEPQGEPFEEWDKVDMILVPGVAFDRDKNRLGRGKGYYDKLLPKLSGIKIGICFPCQLVEGVPCCEWDVRMDKVVSSPVRAAFE